VRLSPKSVFVGLIILGLPFALAVGWRLADHTTASAASPPPTGSGAFGAAPTRARTPASPSIDKVDYWPEVTRPDSTGSSPTPAPRPTTTAPQPTAAVTTPAGQPTLGMPPVPTPTDVAASDSASPSPSPTPSDSTDPQLPLFDRAHWPGTP
jgi:hypothetical protein